MRDNWELWQEFGTQWKNSLLNNALRLKHNIKIEICSCIRNAVAFYDYKKAYDNRHNFPMLRAYRCIGIEVNMIELLKELMKKKNKKGYSPGMKEK